MSIGLQGEPTSNPIPETVSNVAPIPGPHLVAATVEQALAHCDKLEAHVLQFKGKDGHNPFMWLETSGVADFRRTVAKAKAEGVPVGQSLIDATMAIQLETPTV